LIIAKTKNEAERIAAGLGDGESPNWPDIERFNVVERTPERHELIEIEHGQQ